MRAIVLPESTEAVSKPSALSQIERNEKKIPSVIQFCEISKFEFCRIDLQRGRFLFFHTLDPFATVVTSRFREANYRNEVSLRAYSGRLIFLKNALKRGSPSSSSC